MSRADHVCGGGQSVCRGDCVRVFSKSRGVWFSGQVTKLYGLGGFQVEYHDGSTMCRKTSFPPHWPVRTCDGCFIEQKFTSDDIIDEEIDPQCIQQESSCGCNRTTTRRALKKRICDVNNKLGGLCDCHIGLTAIANHAGFLFSKEEHRRVAKWALSLDQEQEKLRAVVKKITDVHEKLYELLTTPQERGLNVVSWDDMSGLPCYAQSGPDGNE